MRLNTSARFLIFALAFASCCATATRAHFQVFEATIAEVVGAVSNGSVTCQELVQFHVDRIHAYDEALRSIVRLDVPGALHRAALLDEHLASTKELAGALHCVPILVKDNYNTAAVETSAGVLGLKNSVPPFTAPAILTLEKAGAIVLGKANMPDLAVDGMNTNSSVLGQTYNAYNPLYTPYGSSGGPAVAAAASFSVFSMGTDTDGSIQNPSAVANLYGLRPTQGLVSTVGVVPLSPLQDTAGPLARTAQDIATVMDVFNGTTTLTDALEQVRHRRGGGLVPPMDGMRVGFLRLTLAEFNQPIVAHPSAQVIAACNATIQNMTAAGATVLDITNVTMFQEVFQLISTAMKSVVGCYNPMFHWGIDTYFKALGSQAPVQSLADLIATNEYMPSVKGFMEGAVNASDNVPPDRIAACVNYTSNREKVAQYITDYIKEWKLDALMYPSANQPPPALSALQPFPVGLWLLNTISAVSGLPALVMPMGFVKPETKKKRTSPLSDEMRGLHFHRGMGAWLRDGSVPEDRWRPVGLPAHTNTGNRHVLEEGGLLSVGMTLLGRAKREVDLLSVAYAAELSFPQRQPPASTPPLPGSNRQ